VVERAELLFSEVLNAISQIAAKGFRRRIGELEELLQREKAEFEVINYVLKSFLKTNILQLLFLRQKVLFCNVLTFLSG